MKKLCIIPARGGSKRIHRKNIKPFLGKPIIAYAIEAALKSELFDEVMVSTDDTKIAEIANKYGAKVPFMRSAKGADDFATTYDVIEEVVQTYKDRGSSYKVVCCLYPTSPLTGSRELIKFYEFFNNNDFDCVFPVLRYSYPIQRSLRLDKQNKMSMIQPEHIVTRSQDLEPRYHDAGQFYWFSVERLLKAEQLWTEHTGALEIKETQAQDIDNTEDWELAELKYKLVNRG